MIYNSFAAIDDFKQFLHIKNDYYQNEKDESHQRVHITGSRYDVEANHHKTDNKFRIKWAWLN